MAKCVFDRASCVGKWICSTTAFWQGSFPDILSASASARRRITRGGRGDNHANKGMGHSGTALNQTEGPTPRRPEQKLYQAISRGCRQGVKGVCDSLRVMSV